MLPSLKCQIFHFLSRFVLFTKYLDNRYNFPKSIYPHIKIKKIHQVDPERNAPEKDGQTDRWTIEQG